MGDGYTILFDGSGVWSIGEEGGGLGELGDTCDAGVLLVQLGLDDLLLSFEDGG